ncbi:hypothetical protein QN277_016178 [Acacia crassicarpa]|nr:hypothetical protein QN277_016178 [Acacia crassicarpa]
MLDFESEVKKLMNFEVANEGLSLNLKHMLGDWEWRRRICAAQAVYYVVHAIYLLGEMSTLVDTSFDDAERESMVRTTSAGGQKRKASMMESIVEKFEKMTAAIKELVDVIRDGNAIAKRHAQIVERHAEVAERRAEVAEHGLSVFEKSRPRHYSEEEVWAAIEEVGVTEEHKFKCYFFLCHEKRHRGTFFGVPPYMRLQVLLKLMADAGIQ